MSTYVLPDPIRKCWCGGDIGYETTTDPYDTAVCLDSFQHDPLATGIPAKIETLYVAGPMSNIPENNYPAFNEAARLLRGAGYTVINPAEFSVPSGQRVHYVDLLREDLRRMLDAQAVAVLPDWLGSTGAFNEVTNARLLKMPVRTVAEWLERAARELQ